MPKATERTTEKKLLAKVRLGIVGLVHRTILNPDNREAFARDTSWHPKMTMIPSEWFRTVGEVRAEAHKAFARGEDTVIVPVLREPSASDRSISITISFMTVNPSSNFWSENIETMDPEVSMEDLLKVLDPNKQWDFAGIEENSGLKTLLDMT